MALDVQPTAPRHPVVQWFIARRTLPLWTLLGLALGWANIVVSDALGISPALVSFGVLMAVIGHYAPRMVMAVVRRRRSRR